MPDAMVFKKAREIGVYSFWYKEVQDAPMLEMMDLTMAGERIFPEEAFEVELGNAKSGEFTERELDVLRLLVLLERELLLRWNKSINEKFLLQEMIL